MPHATRVCAHSLRSFVRVSLCIYSNLMCSKGIQQQQRARNFIYLYTQRERDMRSAPHTVVNAKSTLHRHISNSTQPKTQQIQTRAQTTRGTQWNNRSTTDRSEYEIYSAIYMFCQSLNGHIAINTRFFITLPCTFHRIFIEPQCSCLSLCLIFRFRLFWSSEYIFILWERRTNSEKRKREKRI